MPAPSLLSVPEAGSSLPTSILGRVRSKFRSIEEWHLNLSEADHRKHCQNLVASPRIEIELERWWISCQLFDDNHDGELEYEEYARFHSNLVKAFNKHEVSENQLIGEAAECALANDWERDSKGDGVVDQQEFYHSVVELAVTWCEHDPHHQESESFYLAFLQKMFHNIFSSDPEKSKAEYLEIHTDIERGCKRARSPTTQRVRKASVFRRPSQFDFTEISECEGKIDTPIILSPLQKRKQYTRSRKAPAVVHMISAARYLTGIHTSPLAPPAPEAAVVPRTREVEAVPHTQYVVDPIEKKRNKAAMARVRRPPPLPHRCS
jgi:hypothetical protein